VRHVGGLQGSCALASGLTCALASLQVLSERNGLIEQLQWTVASLEAAALAPNVPDAGMDQLRSQRDEAREQLEQVRAEHQQAMKGLKGQIDRTNAEHQQLDHDRQRVIEHLKAKVLALEAQMLQERQKRQADRADHESPPHARETQGSRSRVLPPPPSPPVHGEAAEGENLESPSPSTASQQADSPITKGQGAQADREIESAREMVHVLRSELHETRTIVQQQKQQQQEREQEAAELAHEVEQRGRELERRGQELKHLHASLAQTQAALEHSSHQLAQLQQQVMEASAAKGALEISKQAAEQTIERVRSELQRSNEEKLKLKRDRDQVRAAAKADMARAADEMERMHKLLQVHISLPCSLVVATEGGVWCYDRVFDGKCYVRQKRRG
jgi:chromosome segregation ATPase